MNDIRWSPELKVDVPEIDRIHKNLVEEIHRTVSRGDEDFVPQFKILISAAESCFNLEDQLMEAMEFPCTKIHREQHARVLGGLHHVMSDALRGDCATGRRAAADLFCWFQLHVCTQDIAMAMALEMVQGRPVLSGWT